VSAPLPKLPSTDVMRQCADGHRTMANMYALDTSEGAEVVAQGSLLTALLLEAAATYIDAVAAQLNAPLWSAPCGCAWSRADLTQAVVCDRHAEVPLAPSA